MIATRQFEPGEIIIRENDIGETAYLIKKGKVEVTSEVDGQTVHICSLGAGSIIGEMSMIDDKPRSATVTAVEETVVNEIHRDLFLVGIKAEQELAVRMLKLLFERLRKANATISKLKSDQRRTAEEADNFKYPFACRGSTSLTLKGLTQTAARALPKDPFVIENFPFLIGRKTRDPLAHNDLMISDRSPYRVSRHHIEFDQEEEKIFVMDRGSHLGSLIDGRKLGGCGGHTGPLAFRNREGLLVLGDERSPFRYQVLINT